MPIQGQQVHALFPTPVVTYQPPEAPRINGALLDAILDRMAHHPGTRHSNLGGWQSTWDLTEWGGPGADYIIAQARELAMSLTCDAQGRPVGVDWQVNAWANVNGPGQGNEFHTHPGSYWSGTYYVDDGGAAAEVGGEFEIQDPRGVAPSMYAPHLRVAAPGYHSAGASETLAPKTGLMVLFPAWLSHAVRPYQGTGRRVSIAFNLSL